jgi:hypothetical protein
MSAAGLLFRKKPCEGISCQSQNSTATYRLGADIVEGSGREVLQGRKIFPVLTIARGS